eukprot:CAMPEP_0168745368 /NCGR_PEP_ID=MMETSP0724-20121128/14576_1 /TAXON_ID=265536 /ORGANISM="Amphiprora sp., Strain CCMP467" /LENGTH=575 /DNA_ID=CAMNT_0008793067 /DNA_START=20 /DNA_END=1747 /DNA_ORIENTATION=-
MALQELSPNAEIVHSQQALAVNCAAASGLSQVLASNLGPKGTLKLLVGGTLTQLKLTKDGLTLLKEMQIQHPTAALIARTATAQDEVTGDGTTSTVLVVGALLEQAQRQVAEGLHPRVLTKGYDLARDACLEYLKQIARPLPGMMVPEDKKEDDDDGDGPSVRTLEMTNLLTQVATTTLGTKLDPALVPTMASAVVQAIQTIWTGPREPMDLTRVEIMTLQQQQAKDSRFVQGLVLDHGNRHPDMPTSLKDVFILICNVSLEYEQTETQANFTYQTAEQREKLVESERTWLDERCRQIVKLKRDVCSGDNAHKQFCIVNQKGVDPLSLDMFAKEGILCLRRAKRRNMDRLVLATGGQIVLSLEDLAPEVLGEAGSVRVVSFEGADDDAKYTFVEDCPKAQSCTMLLHGPNKLTIHQIEDAVKDGLRTVKNALEDQSVVPGAGAVELALHQHLMTTTLKAAKGKHKVGIQAFANALLVIPKTLAANAGQDVQETLLQLLEESEEGQNIVGLDLDTGLPMSPSDAGVWDNVRVKRQSLYLATVLANQLLLVDEVMRAGKQMGNKGGPNPADPTAGME